MQKNEIISFAATWMDLEAIMLSKVRQKKDKYYMVSLIWNLPMKQKQTHKENKLAVTEGEEMWEKDGLGVWD